MSGSEIAWGGLRPSQDPAPAGHRRGQYPCLPAFQAGPFQSGNGLPGDSPSAMPAVEVDMSHTYFSIGMGARF